VSTSKKGAPVGLKEKVGVLRRKNRVREGQTRPVEESNYVLACLWGTAVIGLWTVTRETPETRYGTRPYGQKKEPVYQNTSLSLKRRIGKKRTPGQNERNLLPERLRGSDEKRGQGPDKRNRFRKGRKGQSEEEGKEERKLRVELVRPKSEADPLESSHQGGAGGDQRRKRKDQKKGRRERKNQLLG